MQHNKNFIIDNKHFNYLLDVVWLLTIGIFGRLILHVPNVTPITGLSLFSGATLSRGIALSVVFVAMFVSDLCLSFIFGYPIIGYFSLFTYSGFAMIVLVSSKLRYSRTTFPFYVLTMSCGYWVWTNFGVWLTGNLYPKTLAGFGLCYYLALPFLRNAIVGDLVCSYLIFGVFYFLAIQKDAGGREMKVFSR